MQLDRLFDAGAITPGPDGRIGIDFARIEPAYEELARQLLTIEATGDTAAAEALLAESGDLSDESAALVARLADVPVDIRPIFPVVRMMSEW